MRINRTASYAAGVWSSLGWLTCAWIETCFPDDRMSSNSLRRSLASGSEVNRMGQYPRDFVPMRIVFKFAVAVVLSSGRMYPSNAAVDITMGSPPVKRTSLTRGWREMYVGSIRVSLDLNCCDEPTEVNWAQRKQYVQYEWQN
jgi:hypothetical protein